MRLGFRFLNISNCPVVETAVPNIEFSNPNMQPSIINYTPLGYDNQQELIAQLTEPFGQDLRTLTVDQLDQILMTPPIIQLPYATSIDSSILSLYPYLTPMHSLAFNTCRDISQLLGAILLHRSIFDPGNFSRGLGYNCMGNSAGSLFNGGPLH